MNSIGSHLDVFTQKYLQIHVCLFFLNGHIGGVSTPTWKGYQVSGCSVFKCEMSSKVICHMIWVATWQRCTYGADLEDRKRERERESISQYTSLHNIHQSVLSPPEQTLSLVNIYCTNSKIKHEQMQSQESCSSVWRLSKLILDVWQFAVKICATW